MGRAEKKTQKPREGPPACVPDLDAGTGSGTGSWQGPQDERPCLLPEGVLPDEEENGAESGKSDLLRRTSQGRESKADREGP